MMTKAEFLEEILSINSKYNTDLIGKAYDKAQAFMTDSCEKAGNRILSTRLT